MFNSSYLSIKVKATKRSLVGRKRMIFAYIFAFIFITQKQKSKTNI